MMKKIIRFFKECIQMMLYLIKSLLSSKKSIILENMALRSQLSIYQQREFNRKIKKPKVSAFFRWLWVVLSKKLLHWKDILIIVKPETVISWHKRAFKLFWRFNHDSKRNYRKSK